MADNGNIEELKIGIGADITKLEADIERAKRSIKDVGKTPIKIEADTTDADKRLEQFKRRIEEIKKTTGTTDVKWDIKTDKTGEITKGIVSYTNALGDAKTETFGLVDVVNEVTNEIEKDFQFIGESFSSSSTKVAQFDERMNSVKNTLDSFMLKNADIADQIGMDELVAKFEDLRNSADADVTAIQRFKNELGAAKVKAEEIRVAQRGGAAENKAALQEQMAQEQALAQLRSFYTSNYRQQQERISEIYEKQNAIIQAKIIQEKRITSENSKQKIAALQLQQTTLKTTAYKAKLSVYAKDLAAYINKAKNNMSGMQGYARSTMNIFKGIVLSQAFYKGLNAIKGVVSDAWELSQAINTAEATFSGMLAGGQETARNLLEVLKQEAINTPFDLENLLDATRLITAYGIKAENTLFVLRGIEQATAASGDPTKMESIARALGQIYTKGKLAADEVRQLTEAGIAVSDILREELGLTQEQLSKNWADLNIDANTAINAIIKGIDKKYGKALDNMAKTTEQKISNMKESFALITSSLTDPIRGAIDTLIDTITPKLEYMYQAIQAVGLGNALKSILPPEIFNGAINAIDKIVRAAQALYIVFQQLRPLLSAVLGAFAWYGQMLYNIFISVVAAMGMFGQSISDVTSVEFALRRVLGVMLAIKGAMLLIAAITKIWGVMVMAIKGVMFAIQGVVIAIQSLYAFMSVIGVALGSSMFPLIATLLVVIGLVAALAGTLHSVVGAVKNVGKALSNLGGGTNLKNMFGDMTGGMQKSIDAYNDKVTKQNAAMSKELVENEKKQTDSIKDAANSTKKAMKGLMSFDEVYKLSETAESGGGGADIDVGNAEITAGTLDIGGIFNGVGGIDVGVQGLDLTELQKSLGEIGGIFTKIKDKFNILKATSEMISALWSLMKAKLQEWTGELAYRWAVIKENLGEIKEGLQEAWEKVKEKWNIIKEGLQEAWEKVKEKWNIIKEGLQEAWNGVKEKWITIKESLSQSWESVKSVWESIKTGLSTAWQGVNGVWTSVKNGLSTAWQGVNGVWTSVKNGLSTAWQGVNGVWTSVKNGLSTAWQGVNGVFTKITSGLDTVRSAINTVAEKINKVKGFFGSGGSSSNTNADGGVIRRHAKGAVFKRPTQIGNDLVGEAGTEILFPLENTSFIKAFADDISKRVNNLSVQQSAQRINAQMEQARVGIARSSSFTAPSAKEISDAIKSWFTPQMQSLHDVLEQDRVVDITVPNTSNALWRTVLGELKAVNESAGSRGFSLA